MSEVIWGYCRSCNKEVEVRGGRLIHHLETYLGARCPGSGRPPSQPPREGAWKPPRRAATPVPDPVVQVGAATWAAPSARWGWAWRNYFRREA